MKKLHKRKLSKNRFKKKLPQKRQKELGRQVYTTMIGFVVCIFTVISGLSNNNKLMEKL